VRCAFVVALSAAQRPRLGPFVEAALQELAARAQQPKVCAVCLSGVKHKNDNSKRKRRTVQREHHPRAMRLGDGRQARGQVVQMLEVHDI
jgi:hypothetical protein